MARNRAASPSPSPASTSEETATRRKAKAQAPIPYRPTRLLRAVDALVWLAFLSLTFALGVFPLKDTDFWWHLRTGDLIRQLGKVPQTDWYTYTVPDNPWIDLHWGFQVLLSWGYAHGGVVTLSLAKCVITTVAVALLLSAKRREWPIWAMALAWLPAIFVMGGRMYVRPETLSLLYLSCFLAVIFRWERFPWLAFALPAVQLCWVNTQGLFLFGPIVLACGLIDAALKPGSFAPSRKRWWRLVGIATVLTGVACLFNPYGLRGALFPIQLAQTMRDPMFSERIAELTPIPVFIRRHGWSSVPLQLQLVAMVLGGLSFLLPLLWSGWVRPARVEAPAPVKKRKKKADAAPVETRAWRLSPFRVLLFLGFSALSLQASRNSHQFAAVVGTVTAWNLAEWAAAIRRRRLDRGEVPPVVASVGRRLGSLAAVGLAIGAVLTGGYYAVAGEGRTVGLGEERLWFPHQAVKFAARPEMPPRGLVFHNGVAALYDYYAGPERKVFADARLEVIGPALFARYSDLQIRIEADAPGWEEEVAEGGRPPVVVVDNVQPDNSELSATLLTKPAWRCVWFDPLAAVFLHATDSASSTSPPVDFSARHFRGEVDGPKLPDERIASARSMRNVASSLLQPNRGRRDLAAPLITLGLEQARIARLMRPDLGESWKLSGQFEMLRNPVTASSPIARYQQPFDPVVDLPQIRATYDLLKAVERGADDFSTTSTLASLFALRGMNEAAIPWVERMASMEAINPAQMRLQAGATRDLPSLRSSLGPEPPTDWKNLDELDQAVKALLASGRAASAADLLERAYPKAAVRPWEVADRIGTIRLQLGQPDRARAAWEAVADPPRPGLRAARVAATHLVEGDDDSARSSYRRALDAEPDLFEALFGLALLEHDAGRASPAVAAADRAVKAAPGPLAREVAQSLADTARPFATVSPTTTGR